MGTIKFSATKGLVRVVGVVFTIITVIVVNISQSELTMLQESVSGKRDVKLIEAFLFYNDVNNKSTTYLIKAHTFIKLTAL